MTAPASGQTDEAADLVREIAPQVKGVSERSPIVFRLLKRAADLIVELDAERVSALDVVSAQIEIGHEDERIIAALRAQLAEKQAEIERRDDIISAHPASAHRLTELQQERDALVRQLAKAVHPPNAEGKDNG